jgi:hypothetical protein
VKRSRIRLRKPKITNVAQIKGRAISVRDEDIDKLFSDGKISLQTRSETVERKGILRKAADIVKTSTVAVPRPVGG